MAYSGNSIVDYLKSINKDSSFTARSKMAADLGIKNYKGTAEQNLQMLEMLRSGNTPKPASSPTVTPAVPISSVPSQPMSSNPVATYSSPVLDSSGNAYVMGPSGFSVVGKGANGQYMLNPGERFATEDEAKQIASLITGVNNGRPITGEDLSALSNIKMPGSITPTSYGGYIDPFAESINAAITKYLSSIENLNAPYDVRMDPQYAPLKSQYESMGQSAFNNNIGALSALTGGRPSTAAVGTASGARNKYLEAFEGNVVPTLVSNEMTRRQNVMSGLYNQLQALQNLSNTAYNRFQDVKNDYIQNIDQFYEDFQAEYNRVANDNDPSNDWQLPILRARRQQKIQEQAEQKAATAAKASAEERQAYLDALEEWKISGVASQRVASILGIEPGARTADYDIDRINAAISQQNANTSAKNADTAAKNADLAANKWDPEPYRKKIDSMMSATVEVPVIDSKGKPLPGQTTKQTKYTDEQIKEYIMNLGLGPIQTAELLNYAGIKK